jgi:hypothetical protein
MKSTHLVSAPLHHRVVAVPFPFWGGGEADTRFVPATSPTEHSIFRNDFSEPGFLPEIARNPSTLSRFGAKSIHTVMPPV